MRPFPPTVKLAGSDAAVTDVELLNSYIGVNATNAPRHYIARIQGQPIAVGVFVDQTFDIGRIEDCHFNPWGPGLKGTVGQFQLTHGRGFVIERSDWEYVFNTFAFGYAIGYHFTISVANFNPGIENSKGCNGNFVGIGADNCRNASVQVDGSQPYGLLITNGEFTAFCDPGLDGAALKPGGVCHGASPVHVLVGRDNAGSVRFVNSAFWGPARLVAEIRGSGTVGFSDCNFNSWDCKCASDPRPACDSSGSIC